MKFKLLGKSGLRVTELCLGTMTFGTEWGWGSDFQSSKEVFDAFCNAGGNFLDTANRYTEGTSERWLGEFIKADRDHFVLATKYSLKDRNGDPNFSGNHRKNLYRSVTDSLRRLNTPYIDLLWLHAWDFCTPIEEVMRSLDDLVSGGLVHYIGISDTPAWVVSRCNTLAELRGWHQFIAMQIEYSLLQRTPEREFFPLAKYMDLAITPWAPLAGGALTGKYLANAEGRVKENSARRSDRANRIVAKVVELANSIGVTPAQLAINWTRQHRNVVVVPIIGARTAAQLNDSLKCLDFEIPADIFTALNEVSAIEMGFPHEFLASDGVRDVVFSQMYDQIHNHRNYQNG